MRSLMERCRSLHYLTFDLVFLIEFIGLQHGSCGRPIVFPESRDSSASAAASQRAETNVLYRERRIARIVVIPTEVRLPPFTRRP